MTAVDRRAIWVRGTRDFCTGVVGRRRATRAGGKRLVGRMIVYQRKRELLDVIDALSAACRLPRRLNRRQQQRDQNANDGNDDEQLHERKRTATNYQQPHRDPPEPRALTDKNARMPRRISRVPRHLSPANLLPRMESWVKACTLTLGCSLAAVSAICCGRMIAIPGGFPSRVAWQIRRHVPRL